MDQLPNITDTITNKMNSQENSTEGQAKPLSMPPAASLPKSVAANKKGAYSECLEIAAQIISCYPAGGRDASPAYSAAMAAILADYTLEIARRCGDPRTGIVRTVKFLPAPAEIAAWCDAECERAAESSGVDWREAALAREQEIKRIEREERPKCLSIAELKEKYGDWHEPTRKAEEARLNRIFPMPELRESDRHLKASPLLEKALKDKAGIDKHWSDP